MIVLGQLRQKADKRLVIFVFGCILIVIILLFIAQKATADALGMSSINRYNYYLN